MGIRIDMGDVLIGEALDDPDLLVQRITVLLNDCQRDPAGRIIARKDKVGTLRGAAVSEEVVAGQEFVVLL